MHIQDLANWYQTKSDEELVELSADLAQLTPDAQSALSGELARRRLQIPARTDEQLIISETELVQPILVNPSSRPYRTSEFIPEVWGLYHSQLRFFLRLIAPAIVGSYITVWYSLLLVDRITEYTFQGHEDSFNTMYRELFLLGFARYLISWSLFFLAFGAICAAVSQMEAGNAPSFQRALSEVWKSKKSFLQLCLLLFLFAFVAYQIQGFMLRGLLWVCSQMQIQLTNPAIITAGLIFGGLLYLVVSRFALAVPAVVVDRYGVWRAIFRSDELTEGKWSTLAVLLAKSLIGGYMVAMLPFWISPLVPSSIARTSWYPWTRPALTIIALMLVEPPMFIGFAMLYVRTAKESQPNPLGN